MTDETPMLWERQKTDTDKSYEAFCIYRDMGANRSLIKTADEYYGKSTVNLRQVEKWSSSHDWVNRVSEYDDYQRDLKRQRNEQKRIEIEADALSDYDVIRKAINKRIKVLEDTNYVLPADDLHDLISLMEHANAYGRLNSGLPDKISQNTNSTKHSGTLNVNTRQLPAISDDTLDNIFDDSD